MKIILTKLSLTTAILFFALTVTGIAQTQTVTLAIGYYDPVSSASYTCSPNQIITILALDVQPVNGTATAPLSVSLSFTNGVLLNGVNIKVGDVFTGLTKISASAGSYGSYLIPGVLTFKVTTPGSSPSSIPANAVVIPTDATGPVQIVLESSSDLVNWTSALPGTYGSTYTNRFFRVRAIAQQQ